MTVPAAAPDRLLAQADPAAPRLQRHLWLIELVRHLRGAAGTDRAPASVLQRLRALLAALQADAAAADRVGRLLVRSLHGLDAAALFADFGFNARRDLWGELAERLRLRWLPRSADTDDAAVLFTLAFDADGDADWLSALEPADVDALQALLDRGSGGLETPAPVSAPLHDALGWLISAVRASAFSAPLRRRMDPPLLAERPFEQLARAGDALVLALESGDPAAALAPATYLRTLLGRCRLALASVPRHLSEHGISMHILFECDQTRARIDRVESLVDLLLAPRAAAEWPRLAAQLARAAQERRSVRALLSRQTAMLARQAAERHAETGEHYITRNRAEYVAMLRAAAGGGLVMALTTLAKFGIVGLALAPLWAGLGAGLNYAISFVAIQLLHFTVATKQPAMTGPALVDRLAGAHDAAGVEAFADEVAHLVRSQVAGIVGNLAVVAPAVLALQWLGQWLAGAPPVGVEEAHYVLHSITLLGPTALFAAFTGVLLFASSMVAGWAENAFVLHRLDAAMAHHPGLRRRFGPERCARWAAWWRAHVAGLAGNVSLGLMLGLLPAVLAFAGLHLEVRHVTLSTGQLAAAAGALGPAVLHEPALWWCVAGLAVTGVLNLGVSFWLALRMALRARGVAAPDRALLQQALWRRWRRAPLGFLLPPRG